MANCTNVDSSGSDINSQYLRSVNSPQYRDTSDDMWITAYRQVKKYGCFDTVEPDWGPDIESADFD